MTGLGVGAMMFGWYGPGLVWMIVMPLVWIGLIAVIVWGVIRVVQDRQHSRGRDEGHRETPEEILDRRYARGDIDADAYREARAHLAERHGQSR